MAAIAAKLSEDEFTDQVIELFQLYGWKVVHFDRARKKNGGWRTPIRGDPGSPDIIAARNGTKVFAELKVGRNKPTKDQEQWLHHLGDGAYLWYPCDWETIVMLAPGGVR
jgi:hypothetical protein